MKHLLLVMLAGILLLADIPVLMGQNPMETNIVKLHSYDESGSGFVIGHQAGEVFIVTALHVVNSLVEGKEMLATFRTTNWRNYPIRLYRVHEELDLAVVVATVPEQDIPRFETLYWADMSRAKNQNKVKIIGHPGGDLKWNYSNYIQEVNADAGKLTVSPNGIQGGFSGGAVFDHANGLLGMIIEVSSVEATVVRIDAILSHLYQWNLPLTQLKRYRKKMRADWILIGIGVGTGGYATSLKLKSIDEHDLYANNLRADAEIYADRSRDEVYDSANQLNKQSILTGAVGGVVFLTGYFLLAKRMRKKKIQGITQINPVFDFPGTLATSGRAFQGGFILTF